jgi:hypothetical protein
MATCDSIVPTQDQFHRNYGIYLSLPARNYGKACASTLPEYLERNSIRLIVKRGQNLKLAYSFISNSTCDFHFVGMVLPRPGYADC